MTPILRSAFALAFLASCSHYRTQSAGYRDGAGAYRVASDYSRKPTQDEIQSQNISFVPRAPFQLDWPVRNIKLNRGFHPKSDPKHEGLDLGGVRGTPIRSAHEGIVIYTGSEFRGYGKMVLIEYSHEWATLYAHLDTVNVRAGQIVQIGDPIGGMGRTGDATGIHLHFELLHKKIPTDPLHFLSRSRRFAGLK